MIRTVFLSLAFITYTLSATNNYLSSMFVENANSVNFLEHSFSSNKLLHRRQTPVTCGPRRKLCGSQICIARDAVCCSEATGEYCYPGETCDTTNGVVSCIGRGVITNGNCNGTQYKVCGSACIPTTYDCCNDSGDVCFPGEQCNGLLCCSYGSCGNVCLLASNHTCCNGGSCAGACINNVCCPKNNFLCGTTCVASDLVCCDGIVCSSDQTCFSGKCISSTSPTPSTLSSPPPQLAQTNSTPVIIGSIVGILGLIALSIFAYIFIRNRNLNKEDKNSQSASTCGSIVPSIQPAAPPPTEYASTLNEANGALRDENRVSYLSNEATNGSAVEASLPPGYFSLFGPPRTYEENNYPVKQHTGNFYVPPNDVGDAVEVKVGVSGHGDQFN